MAEEKKYFTRMGDGSVVYMTEAEIRADMKEGIADAVKRGKIDPITDEEFEHLYDIITMPGSIVGVEPGKQIVLTNDSGGYKLNIKSQLPIVKDNEVLIYERCLGVDSVDLGNSDYNYKTAKGVAQREAGALKQALNISTMPLFYGAMTNLGFYTKPDGPVENWAELLPEGHIKEAMAAQEEAIPHAVKDILYVAKQMYDVGADGINLDTSGAAGDADFLAALQACEEIKKQWPEMGVEIGMAGEFVLGMHGKLKYDGVRLAGLYPHKQVKLVEKAGASIFGAVVNTNCNKSFPWNIARVVTFIKACTEVAEIPVHANVGMGVCGVPMVENMPSDMISRADKALVEIGKVDGFQVGVGDPVGAEATHSICAGMGGVRTAGDMVLRMQIAEKMKIDEAKAYVAEKLGVTVDELHDIVTMTDKRTELGLGLTHVEPCKEENNGMAAKFRIADVLGIKINSVERFKERAGIK